MQASTHSSLFLRHGRQQGNRPIGVTRAGRFDFDDVGAEIGKDCRRCRRGDKTAAIQNFQAFEHQLRHSRAPDPENLKDFQTLIRLP
jgi:hypothetical protein